MKNRPFALIITGLTLLLLAACVNNREVKNRSESIKFYVGSSGRAQEFSIFLCALDPVNQRFSVLDSFAGATGSSYLDLSPDGTTLFATSNVSVPESPDNNSVTSFRVNQEDLSLELANIQSSQGRGPCHVEVSPQGNFLFTANYGSGHVTALPVVENSLMEQATSVVRGEGSGPVESRQQGPHAHQVVMDPTGKYLLVPDLGTDKVMNYSFDPGTGRLTPNPEQAYLEMAPGTGPRHQAFHPSGEFLYVLGELNALLTACRFDTNSGVLTPINSASVVEDSFSGNRQSAAVRVHPNGRFVYASNRSDQSNLAVFRKEENGGISRIQIVDDVPYWPRDFNITPDGHFMLVAGERANVIELYEVDSQTGMLASTGTKIQLPSPACILFFD